MLPMSVSTPKVNLLSGWQLFQSTELALGGPICLCSTKFSVRISPLVYFERKHKSDHLVSQPLDLSNEAEFIPDSGRP